MNKLFFLPLALAALALSACNGATLSETRQKVSDSIPYGVMEAGPGPVLGKLPSRAADERARAARAHAQGDLLATVRDNGLQLEGVAEAFHFFHKVALQRPMHKLQPPSIAFARGRKGGCLQRPLLFFI